MVRRSALASALEQVSDACVLVIDDNAANTALVRKVLMRAGLLDVVEIQDPTAVAGFLAAREPDLVLLDLRMPVMDGFDVLELLQRYAASTYLPVVVITADDSHASVEQALEMGAHDFVRKPFDTTELVLRVRNLLVNRSAYLELRRNRAWLTERLGLFEPDLVEVAEDPDSVRRAIRSVVSDGLLRTAVQPIVDMRDLSVVGGEALARFPNAPFPHPGAWFAAALEVGLTIDLELECARRALQQLPGRPRGTSLSVNFSPATVLAGIEDAFGSVPWDRVVIELTEHSPVANYAVLNQALEPLRASGARVAVDDTGAGFASLRHITDIKPDIIKIDIGITRGVDADPSRAAVVTMLAAFAERMGISLVAEGVETQAERSTMLDLGVVHGQGYLFGRPEIVEVG
jgi:EAL domain-containing protein (putative c-di-GMP-specific phosphodiesterase class I)/CheY-like chemotaxis protein